MSENYSSAGGTADPVSDSGLDLAECREKMEHPEPAGSNHAVVTPASSEVKSISIAAVRVDGLTQTRDRINDDTVAEYADAIRAGATFPPSIAFFDGSNHWLADGFHRREGTIRAGHSEFLVEIRHGTRQDAFRFALSANATHGLPRNNADKRNAVTMALRECSKFSDR